jgi:hypothetical protein
VNEIQSAVSKLKAKDDEFENYQAHIGGSMYVSISDGFSCVDFRKFYMPKGSTEIKPTKEGLALRLGEWEQLVKLMDSINDEHPQLATALPCYYSDDHANQMGGLQCPECNPFYTEF